MLHRDQGGPLRGQLREIYGRTVYSHKTHIIQAGMDLRKHNKIKVAQIVLGALTTAGVVTAFLGKEYWGLGISALTSAALTALIAYTKDLDLGTVAAEHKTTSNQFWNIREKYLDLITDLQAGAVSADEIRQRRDALREDLNKVYAAARITSPEAYGESAEGAQDEGGHDILARRDRHVSSHRSAQEQSLKGPAHQLTLPRYPVFREIPKSRQTSVIGSPSSTRARNSLSTASTPSAKKRKV